MLDLKTMKKLLFIIVLPILSNCYFWTISFQKTALIKYDSNQYAQLGERTYELYILKTNINHIIKSKNRDSAKAYLKNENNWPKLGKLNWIIPHDKNSNVCCYCCSDVVDYRKYKFSIADTSIASINEIEHIVFKNSGLGQITFNVKKDGETELIAKKGKDVLKTELILKDTLLIMKNKQPKWKEKVIGPFWF